MVETSDFGDIVAVATGAVVVTIAAVESIRRFIAYVKDIKQAIECIWNMDKMFDDLGNYLDGI